MIRGLIVLFGVVFFTFVPFWGPFLGVLGWIWVAVMAPHQLTYGLASGLPANMMVAVTTLAAWLLSREPKRIPMTAVTVLVIVFSLWMSMTTMFALDRPTSFTHWDKNMKTVILFFVCAALVTSQVRAHAVIWALVLSVGYFSFKGGLFTVLTGGSGRVMGVSALGDNNNMALAGCIILPLINYLRLNSARQYMRHGLLVAMALCMLGILGSYSRGGLIGLLAVGGVLWLRSSRKLTLSLAVGAVAIVGIQFLPPQWMDRMTSIGTASEQDGSFQARLESWRFAINAANARIVGVGFSGSTNGWIFAMYNQNAQYTRALEAHSIYFQVLGDHGYPGLTIFLGLLASIFVACQRVIREAKRRSEFRWAGDLAKMMQLSFIAYMVGGAALSLAYFDVMYIQMAVLIGMLRLLAEKKGALVPAPALGPLARATR